MFEVYLSARYSLAQGEIELSPIPSADLILTSLPQPALSALA